MKSNDVDNHKNIDPMFDGHLERPLDKMSPAERLDWAWEGTLLLEWARQVRIKSGCALPEDHRSKST